MLLSVLLGIGSVSVLGRTLWDGRFNTYPSSSALDQWSWSNQVGEYQAYIFGSGFKISDYVTLSPQYCAPIDPTCTKGARFTINGNSRWNGQVMLRTELIPQNQPVYQGKRFFRFSMKMDPTNPLNPLYEHQLVFFESHFCEIRYGVPSGQSSTNPLRNQWQFYSGYQLQWSAEVTADWVNFAWEVDFSSGQVGLWQSYNSDPLVKVVQNKGANAQTSDFHVGILRLQLNGQQDPATTGVWYSNVFIEDELTQPAASATTTPAPLPTTAAPTQAPAPACKTAPLWYQCGGRSFFDYSCCESGAVCYRWDDFYSQCVPEGYYPRSPASITLQDTSKTAGPSVWITFAALLLGFMALVAVVVIASSVLSRNRRSEEFML